jgi:hypothetical protein
MWRGKIGFLNFGVTRSIYAFVTKQGQWDLHLLSLSEDWDTFVAWSFKNALRWTRSKIQWSKQTGCGMGQVLEVFLQILYFLFNHFQSALRNNY